MDDGEMLAVSLESMKESPVIILAITEDMPVGQLPLTEEDMNFLPSISTASSC